MNLANYHETALVDRLIQGREKDIRRAERAFGSSASLYRAYLPRWREELVKLKRRHASLTGASLTH